MNPLTPLIKFGSRHSLSYSFLVDAQQIHVRNVILFGTGLSMVRLLFGETIHCQNTVSSLTQSFIDTKCFINGTLTREEGSPTLYHDYYQWVSVYLLLLAFGFYFPYSVWSKLFGHTLRHLEALSEKPEDAIRVLRASQGSRIFFKTLALELVYLLYLALALGLTDAFFNGLWSRFRWSREAIPHIFPDDGTCFFVYHQSSGTSDGWFHCLLPLCSVYRKVFTALYLLFPLLLALHGGTLAYRLVLVARRRRHVDVWWAFSIAERCAVSWQAKQRLRDAFRRGELLPPRRRPIPEEQEPRSRGLPVPEETETFV